MNLVYSKELEINVTVEGELKEKTIEYIETISHSSEEHESLSDLHESYDGDSDNELQYFIETGLQSNKGLIVKRRCMDEKVLEISPTHFVEKKTDLEVASFPLINFNEMQKANVAAEHAHVLHNDLDLRELQKLFVRKKKLNFNKMKTEEHSDESDESSSSIFDDDDYDVIIPQGVYFKFV